MASRLGMNPDVVRSHANTVRSNSAALEGLAAEVQRTGEASRAPWLFGISPVAGVVNLVLAEGSIALAKHAAEDIRLAAASAAELLGRLIAEAEEQEYVSSGTEGYETGAMSPAHAQKLFDEAMADPGALEYLSPSQVASWWKQLSDEQRQEFFDEHTWIVGNTNGIPFQTRIAANQLNAQEYLASTSGLSAEAVQYLENVAAGNVNLISFDPAADRIIEVLGELNANTSNIVNYVPGTTASMDGFYEGSTQQIGAALVADDPNTVVFVYKDSPFPTFNPDGVYNSSWAGEVGAPYHEFNQALGLENPRGIPVTSIEHSFATSAGGYAESSGTQFTNRIVLGGIGMTDDWKPNPDTNYYSIAGQDDVIRIARGLGSESLNLGYPVAPTSDNGFTQIDPGFDRVDTPNFAWEVPGYFEDRAEQHTRVAGSENNQVTLDAINEILVTAE